MTVEAATYISQLDGTKPDNAQPLNEGDNHIALIKTVLQNQFPNLGAAAIARTAAEINSVTSRGLKAGDTWTGTHNFTGAALSTATQTTGDSSALAANTAFVSSAVAAAGSVGLSPVVVTTAAYTAVSGQYVLMTNSGLCTLTLPASPAIGDVVAIRFLNLRADNLVARNGSLIENIAEDMEIDNPLKQALTFRFFGDSNGGWRR